MRAFLATVVGGLCAVTASAQVEPTGNIRQTNEDARTSVGLAELKSAFPNVGVVRDQGEITALYGLMTPGETPEAAILDFVAEHADAFGIADIELDAAGPGRGKTPSGTSRLLRGRAVRPRLAY